MHIGQLPQAVREIQDAAMLSHLELSPAGVWLGEDEQVAGSFALVFEIVTLNLARRGAHDRPHLADQLIRSLIQAHARTARVVGFGIQLEYILHMIDKLT